jgi:tRNA modification GTPase
MTVFQTPIIAIATAQGRSAIGVVRVSGPLLGPFVIDLLGKPLQNRFAQYLSLYDENEQVIDQIIAIHFYGPNSFTGEDILELQCHGGPAVIHEVLNRCLQVGKVFNLRLAKPGEFSERAFLY